jgi:hypothetical protein
VASCDILLRRACTLGKLAEADVSGLVVAGADVA